MSATNWATCPQCERTAEARHESAIKKWMASYGTITVEEFESKRPPENPPEIDNTLREDYGLGIDGNLMFVMYYRASCEQCGLEYRKEISEQVNQTPSNETLLGWAQECTPPEDIANLKEERPW